MGPKSKQMVLELCAIAEESVEPRCLVGGGGASEGEDQVAETEAAPEGVSSSSPCPPSCRLNTSFTLQMSIHADNPICSKSSQSLQKVLTGERNPGPP